MAEGGIAGQAEAVVDIGVLEKVAEAVSLLISLRYHTLHGGVGFGRSAELELNLGQLLLGYEGSAAISGEGVGLAEHLNKFNL